MKLLSLFPNGIRPEVTERPMALNVVSDDQSPLGQLGMRLRPVDHAAIVATWPASTRIAPPVGAGAAYWVSERIGWDFDHDWPDGQPTPGCKQISLVRKRPDISMAEFDERYRNHVEVATVHHHGCWRYVQNIVRDVALPGSPVLHAVSELWFRSVDDMLERFYTGPDSPAAVRDDTTGFIDFANTRSYLVYEELHG